MGQSKKVMLEKVIHNSYSNTAGIVVRKNGETVYENYYNDYVPENTVHIASVTKSIFSALFGMALYEGKIQSLDQKVLEFFPDYTVLKGEKTIQNITIRNMLTMTSPYKCKTEPFVKVLSHDHWMTDALDLLGGKGRIGDFTYSPMVGTHLLSGIFVKATGEPVLDYAREHLFQPLGITVVKSLVFHNKEEQAAFSKERNAKGWVVDPEGYHTAAWGLTLSARDMAKIGELYLNHGRWDGQELVPEAWVEESTVVHSHWNKLKYGYLWWIIDEEEHSFAALGDGGNVIYVNPKKNLVVAIASMFVPNATDRIKLIRQYIEPVVCS